MDKKILNQALQQHKTGLQGLSKEILTEGHNEVTLYQGSLFSPEMLAEAIKSIAKAYPELPDSWYDILEELLVDEKFTNERLADAVKYFLKTNVYPNPKPASVLGYNKTTKIYTERELMQLIHEGNKQSDYECVNINGLQRWMLKEYAGAFKKWNYNKAP